MVGMHSGSSRYLMPSWLLFLSWKWRYASISFLKSLYLNLPLSGSITALALIFKGLIIISRELAPTTPIEASCEKPCFPSSSKYDTCTLTLSLTM